MSDQIQSAIASAKQETDEIFEAMAEELLAQQLADEVTTNMKYSLAQWCSEILKSSPTPWALEQTTDNFQCQIHQGISKRSTDWVMWQVSEQDFIDKVTGKIIRELTTALNDLLKVFHRFKENCDILAFNVKFEQDRHRYMESRIEWYAEKEMRRELEENKRRWMEAFVAFWESEEWDGFEEEGWEIV